MRTLTAAMILGFMALTLNACEADEKGPGLSYLDSEGFDSKEDQSWFSGFYGKKHCVWGSDCGSANGDGGSGGGGGMWDGGVGPTDSGGGSDSGSSN